MNYSVCRRACFVLVILINMCFDSCFIQPVFTTYTDWLHNELFLDVSLLCIWSYIQYSLMFITCNSPPCQHNARMNQEYGKCMHSVEYSIFCINFFYKNSNNLIVTKLRIIMWNMGWWVYTLYVQQNYVYNLFLCNSLLSS